VLSQEIWTARTVSGVLQSLITGDLPAPPLAHFCGITPVDDSRAPPHEDAGQRVAVRAIQGRLYGGAIAMLAGTAIDGTMQTTVPPHRFASRGTSRCISCARLHPTGVI